MLDADSDGVRIELSCMATARSYPRAGIDVAH